jgi:hypothetical protein
MLGCISVWVGGEPRRQAVTVFAEAALLALLVFLSGMAAISGFVLAKSIEQEDAGSAKVWGTVFAAASLVAALIFGGLV